MLCCGRFGSISGLFSVADFSGYRPRDLQYYLGNFDVIFLCCDVDKTSNLGIKHSIRTEWIVIEFIPNGRVRCSF